MNLKVKKEKGGLKVKFYKKGNAVIDTVLVLVVLFVFGMFVILGQYLFTVMQNDGLAEIFETSPDANQTFQENRTRYPTLFDSLFITLLVIIWILTIVASFMIDSHPIFFIVTIILLFFVFISAMFMSNIWDDWVGTDADIEAAADNFPMMNLVMDNFLLFIIFIGGSIALALYGKNKMM